MKQRRGVSEIVASLIVLVIVSVLGVMLFNISQEAVVGQQENLVSNAQFEAEKAQERFEVVSVQYTPTAININLLNFGPIKTIEVKVSKIYMDGTPVSFTPTNPTLEQNIVTSITVPFVSEPGKNYNILVVSERGVGNAYTWKSP